MLREFRQGCEELMESEGGSDDSNSTMEGMEPGKRWKKRLGGSDAVFTGTVSNPPRLEEWMRDTDDGKSRDKIENQKVGYNQRSYKDSLMTKSRWAISGISVDLSEPLCPKFMIDDKERERLCKPFAKSLFVKLLVSFREWEDYERALTGGPWVILDKYLSVMRWRPGFNPRKEKIDKIADLGMLPEIEESYVHGKKGSSEVEKVGLEGSNGIEEWEIAKNSKQATGPWKVVQRLRRQRRDRPMNEEVKTSSRYDVLNTGEERGQGDIFVRRGAAIEENNGRQFIKRRDRGPRKPMSLVKENGLRTEAVIAPKGSQQRGKGNGQVMLNDTGVSDCSKKQGLDSVEDVGQYYGDDMEDNGGDKISLVVADADQVQIEGGATSKGFVVSLKNLIFVHKVDMVVLLETRISGDKAKKAIRSFGFSFYTVWIEGSKLIDLGAQGPFFTWRGPKWSGHERVFKRRKGKFRSPSLNHQYLSRIDMRREKPFRFEAAWLKHSDFGNFLLTKWVRGGDVCGNIRVLKKQLGVWSKEVFGHIRYRIRGLCRRLERIQRSKYGRGANWLAECIVRQHDSCLWKNVARLWPEVIKGIGWKVRDGRSVKFWEDRWLNGVDKLGNYFVGELEMLNSTLTVSQTLNERREWNWAWLEWVLPHEVTQLLKVIPPPCPEDGDDIVVWRGDRETAHNRLLTADRRARILGGVPTCSRCGGGIEDLDHVLRSCPESRRIWMALKVLKVRDVHDLKLGDHPELEYIWHGNLHIREMSFSKLKSLVVEGCKICLVIPFHLLPYLSNLQALEVRKCVYVKTIFDVNKDSGPPSSSSLQLKKLILEELPNLEHIWNEEPQGILSLQCLQQVCVDECKSIKSLFPTSVAIDKLEKLELKCCEGLEEIIANEKTEASFKAAKCASLLQAEDILTKLPSHLHEAHSTNEQAIVSVEKVVPKLEELLLSENDITMFSHEQFDAPLFNSIRYLKLMCFHDQTTTFPYRFFLKVRNIQKLLVGCSSFREIFPSMAQLKGSEFLILQASGFLSRLKELELNDLRELSSIGLEHSWHTIPPALQSLRVLGCSNLIHLVSYIVSFSSLVDLTLTECHKLEYVITSSTAIVVHLER
ncbi:hypothetical protein K1719_039182 [Acacia pycnantha]|nr:hypothetical protein K1719_039182 [Acacia pycnantha]